MEVGSEKSRFYFIDYLRTLAAIIIINSHFDTLYPIPALATGGAIGNALFFAVSGFCLWPIKKEFGSWYGEKVVKLYIPTFIMMVIYIAVGRHKLSPQNAFFTFIWPTTFWFVGAILLFYPIYYLLKGVVKGWHFALLFLALSCIYFPYYFLLLDTSVFTIETGDIDTVNGFFRLIYYFGAMMIGKYFRLNVHKPRSHSALYVLCILIGGGSLYLVKLLMNRNNQLMRFQFLNQFSVLLLVVGVLMLGLSIEPHIAKKNLHAYKTVKKVGTMTLHLYVVQSICIGFCERFSFPVNVGIAIVLIGISAVVLQKVSGMLIHLVMGRRNHAN